MFAMIRREGRDHVEVLRGTFETFELLADLPDDGDVLAIVPYRQVRERGFDCVDDGTPLLAMRVGSRTEVPVASIVERHRGAPLALRGGAFDVSDERYGEIVGDVLRDEIGAGEGSNFVIHRIFEADVEGDPVQAALGVFGRLLAAERGAYWTFLVHTGELTLVGATPERHVSVEDGLVMMNPISGTVRYPDRDGLLRFLQDRKEIDELSMVLDEELKMMATVADLGGEVAGPYLKEMGHLVHTEYLLAGRATATPGPDGSPGVIDVRDVLRETMFAPTVVGSPIENACRVIARHEERGRAYYGGVLALFGRDEAGRQTLDAPILIRTAYLENTGRLRVPVGATLVRHSTARGEVAETYTKAAGVLAALRGEAPEPRGAARSFAADPAVQALLERRNDTLARFWLDAREPVAPTGERVLVVDAEDTFTGMLAHQLRSLGLTVVTVPYTAIPDPAGFDLVVAGPGPGDPRDLADPKMAAMRALVDRLLARRTPMLAVCLGHQILAGALGLPVRRTNVPYQGMQKIIDYFGRRVVVGFYSTFAAVAEADEPAGVPLAGPVRIARDAATGDVHAIRGGTFAGVQFHPESVLSRDGLDLLGELVSELLGSGVHTSL